MEHSRLTEAIKTFAELGIPLTPEQHDLCCSRILEQVGLSKEEMEYLLSGGAVPLPNLQLSKKEQAFLEVVVRGGGTCVAYQEIYNSVWGGKQPPTANAYLSQRAVKISKMWDEGEILNVHGKGFRAIRKRK
tara:strand:- start:1107 stop:1502 length:396 start_codon:yes stop_codon:yes gene_type:complete